MILTSDVVRVMELLREALSVAGEGDGVVPASPSVGEWMGEALPSHAGRVVVRGSVPEGIEGGPDGTGAGPWSGVIGTLRGSGMDRVDKVWTVTPPKYTHWHGESRIWPLLLVGFLRGKHAWDMLRNSGVGMP